MVAIAKNTINHSLILVKALQRIAEYWQLGQKQIGEILGMKQSVISNILTGKRMIAEHGKEEEIFLLLIRVFRSLDSIIGSDKHNHRQWLKAYNHALNGVPAELIKTSEGLVRTVHYLDAIRGKN